MSNPRLQFFAGFLMAAFATGDAYGLALDFGPPITLAPSADGQVQYSGVLGYSVDTTGSAVTTVRSGGNNVLDGVFEFDLGAIADDATIIGVRLRLTTNQLISNTQPTATVRFHGYAGDGVVDADDHQNLTGGTLLSSAVLPAGPGNSPPAGTQLEFDLGGLGITLVQSLLGTDRLTIRMQTENFVTFSVASLEHGSRAPAALLVDVLPAPVPLPPAALLLAPAATLLLRRRRRG